MLSTQLVRLPNHANQPRVDDEATVETINLEDLKALGFSVLKGQRALVTERPSGINTDAYEAWIIRWAQNAAKNYPIVSRSWGVKYLSKCAKDVPAVLVGIGPSLEKEIKALKAVRNRAIVIVTDAALRTLVARDIHPDLVVTLDAKVEQHTIWESVDTSSYTLVANSCTHPDTIQNWHGPILFFNMFGEDEFARHLLPNIFPHLGRIPNVGTVGNTAVMLAHGMGCSPLILVGMDFAYSKVEESEEPRYRCNDYKLNGESAAFKKWEKVEHFLYNNKARLSKTFTEKIRDKEYLVDTELQAYRKCLLSNLGVLKIVPINCSRGGTLEQHFPSMSLDQAILENMHEELDPGRTIVPFLKMLIPDSKTKWRSDFVTKGEVY